MDHIGIEECQFVSSASRIELLDLSASLARHLDPAEQVRWYARATDLRLLATQTHLYILNPGELASRGEVGHRIPLSEVRGVNCGFEWADHYIRVILYDGTSTRANIGASGAEAQGIRSLLEANCPRVGSSTLQSKRRPLRSVLFVSGMEGGPSVEQWVADSSVGMKAAGLEAMNNERTQFVEADYHRRLDRYPIGPWTDKPTWRHPGEQAYLRSKKRYYRRKKGLAKALQHFEGTPDGFTVGDYSIAKAAAQLFATRAATYSARSNVRRDIRQTMLNLWPPTQEVTVIAHSLGSVVAADLIGYVPADSRVRLVTLGSPLALDWFHDLVTPFRDRFPFDRVESWINCFDRRDEVTIGRGLEGWCPHVLDLAVNTRTRHGRADYLHCPGVGAAIAASI